MPKAKVYTEALEKNGEKEWKNALDALWQDLITDHLKKNSNGAFALLGVTVWCCSYCFNNWEKTKTKTAAGVPVSNW
jgi:alkylhydroperoxidase family enzyme